jgi:hypothetical protein
LCGSTLIEQRVKKEGDIYKISEHLGLTIDARLSKSHDQYLCLKKLEKTMQRSDDEKWLDLYESLPSFVHESQGMQSFYPYGDRKEYSSLSNDEWSEIGYDSFQDCLTCDDEGTDADLHCQETIIENQPISSSVPTISIWSTFGQKRRENGKASFRFCRNTALWFSMKGICSSLRRKRR